MQKWEYCHVVTMPSKEEEPAQVIITKPRGTEIKKVESDQNRAPQVIGELGDDGWEAVGFAVTKYGHFAYLFKRPIVEEKKEAKATAH